MNVIRDQISDISDIDLLAFELKNENFKTFYSYFAKVNIPVQYELEFSEYLTEIYNLIGKGEIRKDLILLSLLATQNVYVLEKFMERERRIFKLESKEPSMLSNFCMFKKQHWISEIIHNFSSVGKNFVKKNIYNKIIVLKCLELTVNELNLDKLISTCDEFNEELEKDDSLKKFIRELNRFIDIICFCSSINCSVDKNEVFNVLCNKNMLDTLSLFINFEDSKNWDVIFKKLEEQDNLLNSSAVDNFKESYVFKLFTIFATLLDIENIHENHSTSINNIIEDIKEKLLQIENSDLALELLEDIFCILFITENHLDGRRPHIFKNSEITIRYILNLLKDLLTELNKRNIFSEGSVNGERFLKLKKYVFDALWRLELVTDVKCNISIKSKILNYMLASPESLLVMCLREGRFDRAHQVIEIFNLGDTELANELHFNENMRHLRKDLKEINYTENKDTQDITLETEQKLPCDFLIRLSESFSYKITESEDEKCSSSTNFLSHYSSQNGKFMNIMDLLCTNSSIQKLGSLIFELYDANNTLSVNIVSPYSDFCSNVLALYKSLATENKSICDLIVSPDILLNFEAHQRHLKFQNELSVLCDQFNRELLADETGNLNQNHPTHETFLKISEHCSNYSQYNTEKSENTNYLEKLFNYLKAFSKVLYLEQDSSVVISKGKNTSFFELLNYNRSELMGQLLFEFHLNPTEFEEYFTKMELDFLYHLVGNCFPTINLHTEESVTDEELFPENNLYLPNNNIIDYILKRNWLLSFIVKEMYNMNLNSNEPRVQIFSNFRNLSTTKNLTCMFDNNNMITSLQYNICIHKLKRFINDKIEKHGSMYSSEMIAHSLGTDEEIVHDVLKSTIWKELFNVLNSIPEVQVNKNEEIKEFRNMLAFNIINDQFEYEFFKYVNVIDDKALRFETIKNNFKTWSAEISLNAIKAELSNFEEHEEGVQRQLKLWEQVIELYDSLSESLNYNNWSTCQAAIQDDPNGEFEKLMSCGEANKLLTLMSKHKISEDALFKIDRQFFIAAIEKRNQLIHLQELLDKLPHEQSIFICNRLLRVTTELKYCQFFLEYLMNNSKLKFLKQIDISLKMLSTFSALEREHFMCLIERPLEIVEVQIMNTKFDKLAIIMKAIKCKIPQVDTEENSISVESVDKLLRTYAEKALDFRVITESFSRKLPTPDSKLIESIDSSVSDALPFSMPLAVPSKEQWVQNNEVSECMCCEIVTFSMFNRRHHCRRCGRVVCSGCSTKRMLVDFYGDIPVRVCKNCYEQTMEENMSSEKSESVSVRSEQNDTWLLIDDEEHNRILRDEFSFDHAPSVSLCLSILKYHSYTPEYPMFLLNKCDSMLKVLHPSQQFVKEIDYLLVIRMLKSLATAAKMISLKCCFPQGVTTADVFLSQVDLLGLFTERGCLNLLPVSSKGYNLNIDSSALRRLRDKLLEKEQWNTALEVSTKAGLDRTGVFAAWGMSLLKAGCLTKARDKFHRCFNARGRYDSHKESNPEVEEENSNKSQSEMPDRKPSRIPPLLNEIIQVLETKTSVIDKRILHEINLVGLEQSNLSLNNTLSYFSSDPAISILNKLRNLDHIAAGKYYFIPEKDGHFSYASNRPMVDTIFYNECIFYLRRYGTHQGLLDFYLKHGELDQALQYILDNNMSDDVFVDIYMKCLKEGVVNILQENIAKIDYTLELWKNYLRKLCRHLEKQKLLHCLYQLQLFMGDYARAAMTCILFYEEGANSFSDLARKNHFLLKAEEHLKQMFEEDEWVEVAAVGDPSVRKAEDFEEKSLVHPSMIMKLDDESINCYLNTIWRQNEVASFLSDCEAAGMQPMQILGSILPEDSDRAARKIVPTLFGNNMDKSRLAILIIATSVEIEQGFKIASRLIEEFKLRLGSVYCQTGKQLAKMEKYDEIIELVRCIRSSDCDDKTLITICDEMLTLAVKTLAKQKASATRVEDLIKLITDKPSKISAYIEAKQLKSAYFFAVRYRRISDIERISREAEVNNQPHIKALCSKVLQTQRNEKS
ncbi:hypothetical protein WA026_011836 [Henosepilachna vigintioctopunctata]|uniref:FYVE-type domain-containing protein n=1 Tax=Henosepilachna vigintioctopunctata TaxID=420089 RepID=A0AAW1UIE0_9CUCU